MKQTASVVFVSLIALLASIRGPDSRLLHVAAANDRGVPLESLPLAMSTQVVVLSPTNPGHHAGVVLPHGLRLQHPGSASATFHLGLAYAELSGTAYTDDATPASASDSLSFGIYDTSHAPAIPLFTTQLRPRQQVPFHVLVQSVNSLRLQICCNPRMDVDVVATLTRSTPSPTPTGTPQRPQVIPRYPAAGSGVAVESKVLFGWRPFPQATNYAFHLWLVGLNGSATLTSRAPFSFSASIHHKTTYTWDDHGFLPGTYQYSLLPLDDRGHNLAGWGTPTQITIGSS